MNELHPDAKTEKLTMKKRCISCLKSRNMIMLIVFIAILLDNVLLTTIVPIIPNLLLNPEILKNTCINGNCSNSLSQTNENVDVQIKISIMFTIKPFIQLIVNPFIGPITNRIGYSIPMFIGLIILFVSTIIFAFETNYYFLLLARAVQGVGSACSTVSGMGMLATHFTDEQERGRAFAFALSGLAIGILFGAPYGGVTYQFISKEAPFLILASLTIINGILQLLTLKPSIQRENQKGSSLLELLKDPYILIAAGSITFGNLGVAVLEPTLPLWMKTTMNSTEWQQGIIFLPDTLSYLIGTNIFGHISHRIGRGNSAGLGLLLTAGCLIAIPFAKRIEHLIAPMCGIGFAVGMVDSAMMPIMGSLVDIRHVSVYGSVYAIADVAFWPIISAVLVKFISFSWMIWITAIVCFVYAPLTLFLRNVTRKQNTNQ
ncbi:Synaptic vesicular amine transporter [Schistosoma japonicum]|nr:Synaptic vesicular amine transporter [Schistosoma japonicum]KAH8856439.1 Synaptic vesicular amine transporter [Schistosoma japonicum]